MTGMSLPPLLIDGPPYRFVDALKYLKNYILYINLHVRKHAHKKFLNLPYLIDFPLIYVGRRRAEKHAGRAYAVGASIRAGVSIRPSLDPSWCVDRFFIDRFHLRRWQRTLPAARSLFSKKCKNNTIIKIY